MRVMWKLKPMSSPASSSRVLSQPLAFTRRSLPRAASRSLTIMFDLLFGSRAARPKDRFESALDDVEAGGQLVDGNCERSEHLDHFVKAARGFDDEAVGKAGLADGAGIFARACVHAQHHAATLG